MNHTLLKKTLLNGAFLIALTSLAHAASEYVKYSPGAPYKTIDRNAPGGPAGMVTSAQAGVATPPPQKLGTRTGTYWVEVSWNLSPAHPSHATYDVDGRLSTFIAQQEFANGVPPEEAGPVNEGWSGFRALGSATLKNSSAINLSAAAPSTTVDATGGARVSKIDGALISPLGLTLIGDGFQADVGNVLSAPGSPTYTYVYGGATAARYDLSSLKPGLYKIQISWGIDTSQGENSMSSWTFDPGTAGGSKITVEVDNNAFSDGTLATQVAGQLSSTVNNRQWSGFYDLGTAKCDVSSVLEFTIPPGATRTGAVVQFTPVDQAAVPNR